MREDTIAAIATPPGEGAIGIVRLSGAEARAIGSRLFDRRLRDRRAVLGRICDPHSGEIVDEALAIYMQAPHTYTCEDTLEFQAHGGLVCLQRILELALREGARLAEPGEFTLRAFLNGRLDLAQAESVLDIVQARTTASLRLAVQGLGGRLSHEIRALRASLIDQLAYLSARADFPDEDVPPNDLLQPLTAASESLDRLIAGADRGMLYRQGVQIAIVGRPNVGKSSLMNRLLHEERAIVTPIPGTTRDTVSESINLDGIPAVLTDTAGLEQTDDVIETLGIERSQAAISRSDLLLIVLESGRELLADEEQLLADTAARPRLVVVNKCDLGGNQPNLASDRSVRVSALTGARIDELEQRLIEMLTVGKALSSDAAIVTNPRHRDSLLRTADHLVHARRALATGLPEDLASVDLRAAIEALGEITGETVTEDLLDAIFRNFCIGK